MPPNHRARRSPRPLWTAVTGTLAMIMTFAAASPATADTEEHTILGPAITVTTIGDDRAMRTISPGQSVPWIVGIEGHAPEPGRILITTKGTGTDLGLLAKIQTCQVRWQGAVCPTGSTVIDKNFRIFTANTRVVITTIPADLQRWIRFDVTLPDDSHPPTGGLTDLNVRAEGHGESIDVDPAGGGDITPNGGGETPSDGGGENTPSGSTITPGTLPITGAQLLGPGYALAILLAGFALILFSRLRRRMLERKRRGMPLTPAATVAIRDTAGTRLRAHSPERAMP